MINRQILTAVLANMSAFNFGVLIGWLSPALPQINSPDKPIGDVTLEETSWLASLNSLSGVLAPLTMILSNRYGRKICLIIAAVPYIINGIMILLAKDIMTLMIGRFIAGLGVVIFFCNGTAYISEIADVEIRGRLASLYNLLYTFGILASYIFGGFVSYKAGAIVMIVIGVFTFVSMMYVPKSPIFLLEKGRKDEAIKSIAWLKNVPADSLIVKNEIELLQTLIATKMSFFEGVKLLFSSRPLLYGFFLGVMMFLGQGYAGMFVVHGYSVTIFMEGGSSKLTPEEAAVIYSCIQILGAFSTTTLIENMGRKALLLISFFGVAISMAVLGAYFDYKNSGHDTEGYRWIPVAALCVCVYTYTIGAGGIPFVLMVDLLLPEVKTVATILMMQITFLNSFLLLKFFEPLSVKYGRHNAFYFFSVCSTFTVLFTLFFVTETKGKSNQEIIDMNYGFKGKLTINSKSDGKHQILE